MKTVQQRYLFLHSEYGADTLKRRSSQSATGKKTQRDRFLCSLRLSDGAVVGYVMLPSHQSAEGHAPLHDAFLEDEVFKMRFRAPPLIFFLRQRLQWADEERYTVRKPAFLAMPIRADLAAVSFYDLIFFFNAT